jgi:acetoin utilization protein AcuB
LIQVKAGARQSINVVSLLEKAGRRHILTEDRMLVRDRMSTPTVTIRSDTDFKDALRSMESNSLHHLPVLDESGKLIGMAAERDLLIAATRYLHSDVEVGDVMHRGVVTATPGMRLASAAKLMASERIGGLPVVDDAGALVGIITEVDILRAFGELD